MRFVESVKVLVTGKGLKRHTKASREWLRVNMRKLGSARGQTLAKKIENDYNNFKLMPEIGHMYMFAYDPKLKDSLPYYDQFPLIFVVNIYKDGILGINMHYLPPKLRLELYEALLKLRNNTKYDDTTKLKIRWEILKAFSQHKLVKPVVKRYLYTHLLSSFVEIPADDWDITLFLPTESFRKQNRRTVWSKSRAIANR